MTDELDGITDRIRRHIHIDGGCWIWAAACTDGRGVIRINGLLHRADRILWQIVHGTLGPGDELISDCHDRRCVNPDHHHIENYTPGEPCNSLTCAVTYRTRVGPLRTHAGCD